ncbi:hypothetical protein M9Y10_007521 [Tritrichomonas musculus]|uniref:Surface antigen BspA-like n=1 Tax=Tritrichomonas musculus TaxID=1915356 RepID=A0ABR2J3W2_9EUKA
MEYQEYINAKEKLYDILLQFIEESSDDNKYYNLINILEKQEIQNYKEEVKLFFHLLIKISNNHHRLPDFFQKIEKILQFFYYYIKDTFAESEIFDIFKSNKLLILLFIEHKVISVDQTMVQEILFRSQKTSSNYHYFFYPEIKDFLCIQEQMKIEEELSKEDLLNNFEQKRKIGENPSYLCELIRNDSVEEFVSYVNRINLSIRNTTIKPSIIETNNFLIENEPSLIEYAAFYGSIQIFQYLRLNNAEMKPSLWLYAIHSQNAELVHILEECSIQPPYKTFSNCFNESIKCHHNEFANYFLENYLNENKINYQFIFQYYNYRYITAKIKVDNSIFYHACNFNYSELINLYLRTKERTIKDKNADVLDAIHNAANENNVELIYFLLIELSKTNTSEIFSHCNSLKLVALPPNITEIGFNSFDYCSSLINISIPSSVTIIGDYAFRSCSSLIKIKIPFSVTTIGQYAFADCSSLKEISIPFSVASIGQYAFSDCKLEQVFIPFSITSINNYTFNHCRSLKSISLPSSIKSIGKYAFYYCISLESVVFCPPIKSSPSEPTSNSSSSLKTIGDHAFSQCSSLYNIEIPSSVKSVGDDAFEDCPFLSDPNESHEVGGTYGLYLFILIFAMFTVLSIIVVFITSVVWWSRIHPYFSYGYKTGKTVYISLETSWISTLILFAYSLFYLLFCFIIKKHFNRSFTLKKRAFYGKCNEILNNVSTWICIALILIIFVSAIVASCYALKNEKKNGVSIKCLDYIYSGYHGAKDWVANQSLKKQNDFKKWESKLLDKAYGKDGKATNYYCLTVGLPIMIFSILPFVIAIIQASILYSANH